MQGISCSGDSEFGPCTFLAGVGVPGPTAAGADAMSGTPPDVSSCISALRAGAGPAWGCEGMDVLHSQSSVLGHQEGQGEKETMPAILLCAIRFLSCGFVGLLFLV